jgi:hypothetical protein
MNISRNVLLAALVSFSLPVFAGQSGETENAPTKAPTKTIVTPKKVEASTGVTAKAWSGVKAVVCSPVTFIDWISSKGGAQTFATWLGSASKDQDNKDIERGMFTSFFNNHTTAISRLFAISETAIVVAAAYKAYQAFITEEDSGEEYADVFGEEEFVADNN